VSGRLTTHVLDTARGRPAAGVAVELWRLEEGDSRRVLLRSVRTNADGRTDVPLLEGADVRPGRYELVFDVAGYFAAAASAAPSFLDRVPIRFGVADASGHHHAPLLVSPFGYTTYRGS
jgi:5-hydroxyisourate hydrolase